MAKSEIRISSFNLILDSDFWFLISGFGRGSN